MKCYRCSLVMPCLAIAVVVSPVRAQDAPVMSASEARKTMFQLRAQAAQSREKLDAMTEEMIKLDQSLESRVDNVLGLLGRIKDSTDSGTKIIRAKEQALDGLRESIEVYARERQSLRTELNKPFRKLSKEELDREIAVFDGKIEKRIDQIITLSSSLTQSAGYKKYKSTYSRRGGYEEYITDEYKQNRRVSGKTARTKEDMVAALDESVTRLKERNQKLEVDIKNARSTADRERIQREITQNEEKIGTRKEQLASTLSGGPPQTKAVGTEEASSLRRVIRSEAEKIDEEWNKLMALKNQADTERSRIRWLKARYDATKKILDESGA